MNMIISEHWILVSKKKPIQFLTEDMTFTQELHRAMYFKTQSEAFTHIKTQLEIQQDESTCYHDERLGIYHMVLPKKVVCRLED